MSQQYDNKNKGVLFLNDRKESDKHPDRKGSINIDGKEYWLSGWNKQTSRGDTISLSVQAKEGARAKQPAQSNAAPANSNFDDDDLPF
ncbi:hypothetical protein CH75_04700 [Dyella jiangningensis]|nr:hypothetical protein CH75_04700 [Dyella jiangningensis]